MNIYHKTIKSKHQKGEENAKSEQKNALLKN